MGTASDKVFLQCTIRPGSIYLLKPLEFAIFIRSWEKMCFLRNNANGERKPSSLVRPGALTAVAVGLVGLGQLKPLSPLAGWFIRAVAAGEGLGGRR